MSIFFLSEVLICSVQPLFLFALQSSRVPLVARGGNALTFLCFESFIKCCYKYMLNYGVNTQHTVADGCCGDTKRVYKNTVGVSVNMKCLRNVVYRFGLTSMFLF